MNLSDPSDHVRDASSAVPAPRRVWQALRHFAARRVELHERKALIARPWEEEFLHWAGDELHGWRLPPSGRRLGTTRHGWCPGPARAASGGRP